MVEGGKFLLRYMDDDPAEDLTLDYERDVWANRPANISRTSRAQV